MSTNNCCSRTTGTTLTILPSLAIQEVKEKRRKVLEAAMQTRKENYRNFMQKSGCKQLVILLQSPNDEQINGR